MDFNCYHCLFLHFLFLTSFKMYLKITWIMVFTVFHKLQKCATFDQSVGIMCALMMSLISDRGLLRLKKSRTQRDDVSQLSLSLQPLRPFYVCSMIQFLILMSLLPSIHLTCSFCWCVFISEWLISFYCTRQAQLSGRTCSPLLGRNIHLSTTSSITFITEVSDFTNINVSTWAEFLWDEICDRLELWKLMWREIRLKVLSKFWLSDSGS